MARTGRAIGQRLLRAMVLMAAMLALGPAAGGGAQGMATDWEQIGPPGAIVRVFPTADGALLAQTADDQLFRGDGAEGAYRPVPLPPLSDGGTPRVLGVDPTDADILYAVGEAGLYRSLNGGETWTPILGGGIAGVSASPAEPGLVYVAAAGPSPSRLRFLRSADRGATFELLEELESQNPNCVFGLSLLRADELDPRRVFRSASCIAGRDLASPNFTRPLERSDDRGATWIVVARPPGGFSDRLVGGAGGRYYLSDVKPFFANPAALYRSDDDAATFAEVFQFPRVTGDVAPTGAGPQTAIGGLAYDPTDPDRVFLGRRNRIGGVLASANGGLTFAELGRPDIGEVLDLALAPDDDILYAATTEGLFRLVLGREALPQPAPTATPTPPPAPVQLPRV